MPPQLRKPEVELEDCMSVARGLAKGLRQSIYKARKLRLSATQAESRLRPKNARRQAPLAAKGPPLKGNALRTKAGKATAAASKLLGHLLDVKGRIELSLLRSDDRYGPLRDALEKLTFATVAPASSRWPAVLSFDEESVLQALDRFELLLDSVPISDHEGPNRIELSGTLKNGQFCDRVIEEIRKIRHFHPANTVTQIRADHPSFLVWAMIDAPGTDAEDRDIFFHPTRWGPVVGYATKLLARHFGKSEETIRRWRKAYRKYTHTALGRNSIRE